MFLFTGALAPKPKIKMMPILQKTQQKNSYAHVADQPQFPTREHAIILDSIEGITIQEYTLAVGKLVGSKNVRFVSRISHGRVCIYLNSKETADSVITDPPTKINIGSHCLEIRPLITKSKRIILSNVCPIIPHNVILDELRKRNVISESQMTFIKAGISDPEYSHVLSFRRQMYILPEYLPNLPESMQITFDDTPYHIYLSTEKLACFLCKEEGHVAKFCKNQNTSLHLPPNGNSVQNVSQSQVISAKFQNIDNSTFPELSMPPPGTKRDPPISTNSESSWNTMENKNIAKRMKKLKKSSVTFSEVSDQLEPAKSHINKHSDKYPLDTQKLTEYLVEAYDNPNILDLTLRYTNDNLALDKMLTDISPYITVNKFKNRIKRLQTRLNTSKLSAHNIEDYSSYEESEVE